MWIGGFQNCAQFKIAVSFGTHFRIADTDSIILIYILFLFFGGGGDTLLIDNFGCLCVFQNSGVGWRFGEKTCTNKIQNKWINIFLIMSFITNPLLKF